MPRATCQVARVAGNAPPTTGHGPRALRMITDTVRQTTVTRATADHRTTLAETNRSARLPACYAARGTKCENRDGRNLVTTRAVVLARGLGRRMRALEPGVHLTDDQRRAADRGSKAMMPINGRTFLDYVLSAIADAGIRHVALIVAPDHGQIAERYASASRPSRVELQFVIQQEALGTANAMLAAEAWAGTAAFLAMNADNLYPVEGLRHLAALDEPGLLVFDRHELVRSSGIPAARIQSFALLEIDDDGYLTRIEEKPPPELVRQAGPHASVSMNCWRLDDRIFDACRDVPRSLRGEFELPVAVGLAIERGMRFKAIPARGPVLDLSARLDVTEISRRLAHVTPQP
jgi:dTDP-glucose pyrophosphorylase